MDSGIGRLISVMARLRDPKTGCPWDLEQTFRTIAPYTLEETYEAIEAIERGDTQAIKEELGDVLFQIAFHAQMGAEQGLFTFDEIAATVADKMIERHPHVFGERDAKNAGAVAANWEADKAKKREAAAKADNRLPSALDGVSIALPAATRAVKLQSRAARVGFDWTETRDILAKVREEIGELEAEIGSGAVVDSAAKAGAEQSSPNNNKDGIEDELGDLFFALVNLARRLEIDPEAALRRTNRKFERRFREVELRITAQGRAMTDTPLDEMERIWNQIKADEKRLKKAG